jgi:hypothetical protein
MNHFSAMGSSDQHDPRWRSGDEDVTRDEVKVKENMVQWTPKPQRPARGRMQ